MALWKRGETSAVTSGLPLVDGAALLKVMEAQIALEGVTLEWLHPSDTGETRHKKQHYKICGLVSCIAGSFIFACDAVERLGTWSEVEGKDRARLETRLAVGAAPKQGPCYNLPAAREFMTAIVQTSILKVQGKKPEIELERLMPLGYRDEINELPLNEMPLGDGTRASLATENSSQWDAL